MNLTISKGHKAIVMLLGIGTIASAVGTIVVIPRRIDKVEQRQDVDHDLLIELKTEVKEVNKKLDRNNIGQTVKKYQAYEQASTNTGSEFDTN